MWKVRSYDLETGGWNDLCNLKEGVCCPGIASNGNLIYIYESTTLQIYNIRMNTVSAYYFTDGLESSGLFYVDGKLYVVGGRQQLSFSGFLEHRIEPENVFSIDVSRISSE